MHPNTRNGIALHSDTCAVVGEARQGKCSVLIGAIIRISLGRSAGCDTAVESGTVKCAVGDGRDVLVAAKRDCWGMRLKQR